VTSSWFFLSTLNYDARSDTHQINKYSVQMKLFFLRLDWKTLRSMKNVG